ncbi:uncharacterized protein wu:fi75a02 isoform X2 [Syngnathoides biaculeatus]|uniref:uncharacterized protein wu:fi75a02 isoform X2 n=1 Tax=Syngnathoides biaculeatus TaxID=300417 RepID=UPI002ADD9ACA|nr:uncharacterized protein wu:fi75a02 isoform X2 [Syngnathoides biaculeatus]
MLSRPPPGATPPPALPLADNDADGAPQTRTLPPPGLHHHHHHHHPGPQLGCPCSSLLPRLLSAHRMEVRRLLRGALVSLGRRVDALERKGGRKRRRRRMNDENPWTTTTTTEDEAEAADASSSCSSRVTSSSCHRSSSALEGPPLRTGEEEEEEGRGGKRRRKIHGGGRAEEEEEDGGRSVGRVAVCRTGGGATDRAPLTLFNFDPRRRQEGGHVSVVVGRNGCSAFSQAAFDFLRALGDQSQALRQWRFSDVPSPRANGGVRLCAASVLRLSVVAVAIMAAPRRNPRRPLRDRTAPPCLGLDHCYVQAADLRQRRTRRRANRGARKRLPAPPLPPRCADVVPTGRSEASPEEKAKRVSQIRIRRASPRETPLTPMGLPKAKRLKKKEFSVEEIYTNKNYNLPSSNRSLETIFEEPQEKDGALLLIGQQRRRRLLLFPDFTQPRKRKRPLGAGLPVVAVPRKRAVRRQRRAGAGADERSDLDVKLVEKLSALEDFLTRQSLDA